MVESAQLIEERSGRGLDRALTYYYTHVGSCERCRAARDMAATTGEEQPGENLIGVLYLGIDGDGDTVVSDRPIGVPLHKDTLEPMSRGAVPEAGARVAKAGASYPRDAMGTGRGASPSIGTPWIYEMSEAQRRAAARDRAHNADNAAGRPASSGHGQERRHSRTPPTNTGLVPVETVPWAMTGDVVPTVDDPFPGSESLGFLTENLLAMHTRDLEMLGMRVAEILSSRDYGRKGKEKGHQKGGGHRKGGSGKKGARPGKGAP